MAMAEEPGSIDRREIGPRRRKARLPFVKWVTIWTIVAAIAGGIFGVTRLLAALAGEPSVAGIAPFTVTGVWAGVVAVPSIAVAWALCGAALALVLYLVYLSIDWVLRALRGPAALAGETDAEGSRRVGE